MLEITNLHASVEGEEILRGVDLKVDAGEVHAIMGPNGSGKSTLAQVLAGQEDYAVDSGSVVFQGDDMVEMSPEERARSGVFLGFQYPVEIPGIETKEFLRAAYNEQRKARNQEPVDVIDFEAVLDKHREVLDMDERLLNRSLNEGFSGGEKKRNEILQMLTLDPALAVLDETDSGLDIDALKIVARGINAFRDEDNAVILITHYQRILDYIEPNHVHVMLDGKLAMSGGPELAAKLEENGYDWVHERV